MRVVCSYCDKAYLVPDHKIPVGKKVKARCKACDNAIIIERKVRATAPNKQKLPPDSAPAPEHRAPSREIAQPEGSAPGNKPKDAEENHEFLHIQSIDPQWSIGNFMAEHGRLVYTGALAVGLFVLGLLGYQVYDYMDKRYFGGEERAFNRYLRQVAEQIRATKRFPEQINNQVTLTGVEAQDGKLAYLYTFLNFDSDELAQMSLIRDMRSSLMEPICLGYIPGTRDDTLTYSYDAYGSDNVFVSTTIVDIADCR